ncbi:hypothetical protein M011DRAFT_200891 [Sporormia fimetaria CBS 119925]|uniref:Uncharacterized protein n=1 Tax=Sporormia fimetaria CBS 119925 TaxID=1340428 RepID=A0A6A6V1R6_9PLEO|nr:hypothetical protein M011DRAFT_200891 [Sporormia fimetaria CBS 119925]
MRAVRKQAVVRDAIHTSCEGSQTWQTGFSLSAGTGGGGSGADDVRQLTGGGVSQYAYQPGANRCWSREERSSAQVHTSGVLRVPLTLKRRRLLLCCMQPLESLHTLRILYFRTAARDARLRLLMPPATPTAFQCATLHLLCSPCIQYRFQWAPGTASAWPRKSEVSRGPTRERISTPPLRRMGAVGRTGTASAYSTTDPNQCNPTTR